MCNQVYPCLFTDIPRNFELVYYHDNKTCKLNFILFCFYFGCYMNEQTKFKFVQFDFDLRQIAWVNEATY